MTESENISWLLRGGAGSSLMSTRTIALRPVCSVSGWPVVGCVSWYLRNSRKFLVMHELFVVLAMHAHLGS